MGDDPDDERAMRRRWAVVLVVLGVATAAVVAGTSLKHQPLRVALATLLPIYFMYNGIKKHSLSLSGAICGWGVACLNGLAHGAVFVDLIVFFVSGSKLTRFKAEEKKRIEGDYKEGGRRNWVQVLCNGGPSAIYSLMLIILPYSSVSTDAQQYYRDYFILACLSAYATCCGDTWASEVGTVASTHQPRLITTLRTVPRGTNGGVSTIGVTVSALGGLAIGCTHWGAVKLMGEYCVYAKENEWRYGALGLFSGLLGSIFDSLLGATVQYSGWDVKRKVVVNEPGPNVERVSGIDLLDNHMVNLLSVTVTSIALPLVFL